ncbi:MAG: 2-amino-4-hydroxy-6-hydroxymethyldihydropteridine diphosphokinase [Methylovulum sp.]|nr:2-amino-4-hydroxy-6-hydroxymethyldihydropteridine diphosphokinase [Methylovulum sp.]
MTRSYISIGSNIDRHKNITLGLQALDQQFGKLVVSSLYEYEPVGFSGDSFYNLVAGFDTELDINILKKKLRQIEFDYGRTLDSKKFSARTLDLDLILYGDLVFNDGNLQIPRAEIEHYAFVLEPLAEIAPTLAHPVLQLSYAELWQKMHQNDNGQQHIGCPIKMEWSQQSDGRRP